MAKRCAGVSDPCPDGCCDSRCSARHTFHTQNPGRKKINNGPCPRPLSEHCYACASLSVRQFHWLARVHCPWLTWKLRTFSKTLIAAVLHHASQTTWSPPSLELCRSLISYPGQTTSLAGRFYAQRLKQSCMARTGPLLLARYLPCHLVCRNHINLPWPLVTIAIVAGPVTSLLRDTRLVNKTQSAK